jgi:D-mannonate dehydratase
MLQNIQELDLQLSLQSVPITTKVVSSNPVHGEVYSIQHYVIKFVSDLRQVSGFHIKVIKFCYEMHFLFLSTSENKLDFSY